MEPMQVDNSRKRKRVTFATQLTEYAPPLLQQKRKRAKLSHTETQTQTRQSIPSAPAHAPVSVVAITGFAPFIRRDGISPQPTTICGAVDVNADDYNNVLYDGYLTMQYRGRSWVVTKSSSVYCSYMKTPINLEYLARQGGFKYNSTHVPAVNFPINFPKCTLMIYESGKVICLGGEDKAVAVFALQAIADILRSYGIPARCGNIRLENTTCVVKPIVDETNRVFPIRINLQAFSEHPKYTSRVHCPKNFKAALFRNDTRALDETGHTNNGVSVNIFESGNCNMLGTRNEMHMLAVARFVIKMVTHVSEEQRLR